jgi:hypothetical protein
MKQRNFLILTILVSLTFSTKVMADTSQPEKPSPITEQQILDKAEITHEQNAQLQAKAHQLQAAAEKTHERNVKIQDEEEANQARFVKILSTWERQQQQYQAYLDSLKH